MQLTAPFLAGAVIVALCGPCTSSARSVEWAVYGGSPAGDRYSELRQVNRSNVGQLKAVWRHATGEGSLQTTPLMIGSTLYAYTPTQSVIALDAATGALLWRFDPDSTGQQPARGLSYWKEGKARRLFASAGTYLYALDPSTGAPVTSFGENGKIDLRRELGRDPSGIATFLTSPGIVYKHLIIVGFRTSEDRPAAPGAVRAYDVRTGRLRWTFNLIPRPREAGHDTWPVEAWKTAGGANVWAGFALDEKRGIVYAPTGSAVSDFYGGDRAGGNLYANSLVALKAATGKRLWHFQAVHHDLWDRDLPSPPVLLTVVRDGRRVDAVAQTAKHGFVFLFDRVTGEPLFPIEERPVPRSDVPGEQASPTQPFPLKPEPFARQRLTTDLLTTRTRESHAAALREFESFRNEGPFTPLTLGRQTVVFPGFDGGAEWGGPAIDRKSGVIYVNSNDIAWLGGLVERSARTNESRGQQLYEDQCSVCHGIHRQGAPPEFPPLADIASRLSRSQMGEVIVKGRGRMPGFPQLEGSELNALVDYLSAEAAERIPATDREVQSAASVSDPSGYLFTGYRKWLDAEGYPAVKPPWGTLNAIDLNSGEYRWKVPLGEYPALAARGMVDTGTENYGGPLVTAGGLVFIGATIYDRKFRAFDSRTGERVWEAQLPFAGVATPVTYMTEGRQYLVIACSGARDHNGAQGSAYVAFALPSPASAQEQ